MYTDVVHASISIKLYNECSSFKMMLQGRATSIYRVHKRVLVTCFSLRQLGNLRFLLKNIVFVKVKPAVQVTLTDTLCLA